MTQIADPAGLIQRLGRLNRRHCGHALDAFFYPDEKMGYPYSKEDLDAGLTLVQHFAEEVNQADLAAWLEKLESRDIPECKTVLLDGEWRTYPAPLREEGFSITAVLEQDLTTVKTAAAKELPRYTVPLPGKGTQKWQRYKFYPIAPADQWEYSEEEGGFNLTRG